MSPSRQPLLSAGFLERLEALRETVFRFDKRGELLSRASGETPEFDAHRSYGLGDDPRYVDWNAYARLERLLIKMYVMDDETQVSVFVDVSRSMRQPGAAKLRTAARTAAAFSYLAVSGAHGLTVGAFSDRMLSVRGPYRSQQQFASVIEFLNALPDGRRTDLGQGVGEYLGARREPTFLVVISDLFQEKSVLDDLERLRRRSSGVHLVQVIDPVEAEPPGAGEIMLEDAETDFSMALFLGEDLRNAYRRRFDAYVEALAEWCRAKGIPQVLLRSDEDFEQRVLEHLLAVGASRGTRGE